jgi:hypothetical protein
MAQESHAIECVQSRGIPVDGLCIQIFVKEHFLIAALSAVIKLCIHRIQRGD